MFDYIRVLSAVPDISVCDTEFNASEIIKKMKEASKFSPDIVVFPELSITGYTCGDLFFQRELLDKSKEALIKILNESKRYDFTAVLGLPLQVDGRIFNCAAVITNGIINGIAVKTFLPNYNEYYEKRWFSPSNELKSIEITYSSIDKETENDYKIPIGSDLIFDLKNFVKFSLEICEDLWAPLPPSTLSSLNGAELIINLSASNETISKREYRRDLVKSHSASTMCAYVYASAGECESTQDLVFSGHSVAALNGVILGENEKTVDSDYVLPFDIDIGKIKQDRIKYRIFSDCASIYGDFKKFREVVIKSKSSEIKTNGELSFLSKTPFVPLGKDDLSKRCEAIFDMQTAGLKKRLKITKAKPVIGVSGGLDSTLALLVSLNAVKALGRDASNVLAVTLPCFGTTDRTLNNAKTLMEKLNLTKREINIKEACALHCRDVGHDINKKDVTFENIQARERTQILMDIACEEGGLVVGTGDLSELALGWCTYNADHMSMYNVNASIPKTLVKWMINEIASMEDFKDCRDALLDIIDTPISPELLPPDESGNIAQETETLIGPYILNDFFLYYVLRYGFAPSKIYNLAKTAFKDDFSPEIILKHLKSFYKRFFSQQFKRSCLPDCVKIGSVALSPRGDWRAPSDASARIWLDELDNL